ncbi:MAG: beta-ketoacyl-ACP synthase II [Verrucomicrobiota bacterium]
MSKRRVVVTGVGVFTPLGNDLETYWTNLLAGQSGVARITQIDANLFGSQIAGEVKDFDPLKYFSNPKESRRCDRYAQLALAAAKDAISDAGLAENTEYDPERSGVLVGSGIGGLRTLEDQHTDYMEKGSKLSPFMIPMMISNISSGVISIEMNFKGPNFAIVTACATATHSIGEAYKLIAQDEMDVGIAGGSEAAVTKLGVGGFASMKALSTRNDDPEKASRPFDKDRDGFVLAEGSGIVVLEAYEKAKSRGAKIYGEIVGYGCSGDAYHMTSPPADGYGAALAMKRALQSGSIDPENVGYINAHGTSTPLGDIAETRAIKSVFGDHAKSGDMLVSSTKSMTGHLLGAAGGVELAVCLKTLQTGQVHPTINIENQDPECDLDYVKDEPRNKDVQIAMSNSFGFGGHNACLIAQKVV